MTDGIRVPSSLENRKNPEAGTTLHDTRGDQNVLVMLDVNRVLPRNSLSIRQRKVRHLSVDSYVYRSWPEVHATQVEYSPIKPRPAFFEMPEARLGDYCSEHYSLTD